MLFMEARAKIRVSNLELHRCGAALTLVGAQEAEVGGHLSINLKQRFEAVKHSEVSTHPPMQTLPFDRCY
jgi:hypothetical protein